MSSAVSFSAGTAAWLTALRVFGLEQGTLLGNVGWFGLATVYFGFMNKSSVMWTVPRRERGNKVLLDSISESMGFLGGMNAGMVLLSAMFLAARRRSEGLFKKGAERRVLFSGFALGHLSQVYFQRFNPPGVLRYIYWMDLAQAIVNAHCAWVAADMVREE